MKMAPLLLATEVIASCLACSPTIAGEPALSVHAVLQKWERISKECQILDAKLTVLRYDAFHADGDPVKSHARFYYEAPNFARYQTQGGHGKDFVWTAEGVFYLRHQDKTCQFWPSSLDAAVRAEFTRAPEGTWFDRFIKRLSLAAAAHALFSRPEELLPLVVNVDAQRSRFDFQVQHTDGMIVLQAKPKQHDVLFQKVDLMLDADTYALVAHRSIDAQNPNDKVVHVFDEVKINSKPADRQALLNIVPSGYKVERLGDNDKPASQCDAQQNRPR